MSNWLAGYNADDEYDDTDAAESPDAIASQKPIAPPLGEIILCKHCNSYKLKLRSTEDEKIKFVCDACQKWSTFTLPMGYTKIFMKLD